MRLLKHSIRFCFFCSRFYHIPVSFPYIVNVTIFNTYAPCIRISKYRGYFCWIDAFYGVDYDIITWTLFFLEDVTIRLSINKAPVLKWENYDKDR